jgi:hypothetical protein
MYRLAAAAACILVAACAGTIQEEMAKLEGQPLSAVIAKIWVSAASRGSGFTTGVRPSCRSRTRHIADARQTASATCPVYLQNIYLTATVCGRTNAGIDGKQLRHRRLRDLFALPPCREALPDEQLRGPGRNRAHLFRASS